VEDHARAIWEVLTRGRLGEVYNIGGRAERPNIEIVRTLLKSLKKPESLIRYVTDRAGHDRRYAIHCEKLRREPGLAPQPAAVAAALAEVRPDVVINAAAYTLVDRAEAESQAALAVNGAAVGQLGRLAREAKARVVHFSTDYVFDGTATVPYGEECPRHPVNAYGMSKAAGEKNLQSSGAESLIVRTQWLFGEHGTSFPRTMWERARAGSATRVVNDTMG